MLLLPECQLWIEAVAIKAVSVSILNSVFKVSDCNVRAISQVKDFGAESQPSGCSIAAEGPAAGCLCV